jgi:Xaa-Pro aminopeptidase
MTHFQQRRQVLGERLAQEDLAGLLLTNLTNVGYLSGFSGSAGELLLMADRTLLFVDFRYQTQAAQQAPECERVDVDVEHWDTLIATLKDLNLPRLGFEGEHLPYNRYARLSAELGADRLVATTKWVEERRAVKDETELALIRQAVALADRAMEYVLTRVRPGVTERELAAELEYFLKRDGADEASFRSIVASGPQSAQPHAGVSDRALQSGDFVIFDLGARREGYCSDVTRTVCVGPATDRHREIYHLVYKAQTAALAGVRPGAEGIAVDAIARGLITAAGHGEHFGHGLGHGVGRDIHEAPRLSQKSQDTLCEGMIVTVEPGVYLPGWGGVRIEDLVVVTAAGCEILTGVDKPATVLEL